MFLKPYLFARKHKRLHPPFQHPGALGGISLVFDVPYNAFYAAFILTTSPAQTKLINLFQTKTKTAAACTICKQRLPALSDLCPLSIKRAEYAIYGHCGGKKGTFRPTLWLFQGRQPDCRFFFSGACPCRKGRCRYAPGLAARSAPRPIGLGSGLRPPLRSARPMPG